MPCKTDEHYEDLFSHVVGKLKATYCRIDTKALAKKEEIVRPDRMVDALV